MAAEPAPRRTTWQVRSALPDSLREPSFVLEEALARAQKAEAAARELRDQLVTSHQRTEHLEEERVRLEAALRVMTAAYNASRARIRRLERGPWWLRALRWLGRG